MSDFKTRLNRILLPVALFYVFAGFVNWTPLQAGDTTDTNPYIQARRQALFPHKQHLRERFVHRQTLEAQSAQDGRPYDALYYKLELTIQYDPNLLNGNVTARFESQQDSLTSVKLDLDDALTVTDVGGQAQSFKHIEQELLLNLGRPLNEGERFEVTIAYNGKPQPSNASYFSFDWMPDGSPHVWTLSEPYGAKYWWPCKDMPKDKADSMDIIITVPDGQWAGSNGTLISDEMNMDGTRTFHWREQYPIATYLVSLAIGNYAHFQDYYKFSASDSMLLDYYVYPQNEATAKEIFQEMHDYMDALQHYFGPYPFREEKYGHAQFNWGGAMEHQTLSSIGGVSSYWRYVYVHELAHQWYGDAVTCGSWKDIWLNEGFASYSEALYAEWAGFDGHPPGEEAYHAYMETQFYGSGGTIIIEDTTDIGNIFSRIVYDKGSWVLHMLRGILGDDVFFEILKDYVSDERWSYGAVRTNDFKTICEEKSGRQLDYFFDQWLNFPYYPRYEYEWEVSNRTATEYQIEATIRQVQTYTVYEMPIDLSFEFKERSDTTVSVWNNNRNQQFHISLPEEPVAMHFDPNDWILKQAREVQGIAFSKRIQIENIYPNPFRNQVHLRVINWIDKNLELQIYDVLGRKVRRLVPNQASQYDYYFSWDGRNESGKEVASGVYYVIPMVGKKQAPAARNHYKLMFLK